MKAEEGVPESKQHTPGAVPCSWRRVGPRGFLLSSEAADRKTSRVGSAPARALSLESLPGPGKPDRDSGPCYKRTLRIAKISLLALSVPVTSFVTCGESLNPRLSFPTLLEDLRPESGQEEKKVHVTSTTCLVSI